MCKVSFLTNIAGWTLALVVIMSSPGMVGAVANYGSGKGMVVRQEAVSPTPMGVKMMEGLNKQPLTETKERSCQAREMAVEMRMNQLTRLATNMEETFDAIAKRVEDYYITKLVPQGKTLGNYNDLLNNVSTKKDEVTNKLNKAKVDIDAFSCTENPKNLMVQFRLDMQAVKTALKDYRTAIHTLIVNINSVATSETIPTTTISK